LDEENAVCNGNWRAPRADDGRRTYFLLIASGDYMRSPLIFCADIFQHTRFGPQAAGKNDLHTQSWHFANS
jgi:hypothetical protein